MNAFIRCMLLLVVALPALAQESYEQPLVEATWADLQAADRVLIRIPKVWRPPHNQNGWNAAPPVRAETPEPQDIWGGSPFDAVCPGGTAEPTLARSFVGMEDSLDVIPPDTMGAVGPDHVMTMTNSLCRVHRRDGQALQLLSLDAFWSPVFPYGACDPKLVYDAASGRWIAAAIECSNFDQSRIFLAVSATSDPLGTWRYASVRSDSTAASWSDYPQLGANSNWIVVTANMFPNPSGSPLGTKMWVFDKRSMLSPGFVRFTAFNTGFDAGGGWTGFTMQPCFTHDPNEPSLYLVDSNLLNGATFAIRISRLTGTYTAPVWSALAGGNTSVPGVFINGLVASNPAGVRSAPAEQLGETNGLEAIGSRLLNAVFRNGRIWTAYDAFLPASNSFDRIGAAWVQIDPGAMPSPVVQAGVVEAGPHTYHIYPSVAVNCGNDMALGFTRTDPTRYPEAAFATRLAPDLAGTMRTVRLLKAGQGPYYKTFGGSRNRWGDYSSTVVDPRDDLSFWTVQEWAMQPTTSSRWATWWGQLQVVRVGDANCDGVVDFRDINAFVLALSVPADYVTQYPDCNFLNSDCNQDGVVDFRDINAFVPLLGGG
jgi:hypothetical protein